MIPKTLYLFVLILASYHNLDLVKEISVSDKLIISILPLGGISDREVIVVRDSLSVFCNCEVRILERILKPDPFIHFEIGINPFQKKIFEFLDSYATSEQEKIIAISNIPFKLKANDSSENTIRGLSFETSTLISNVQIIRDATKHGINYDYLLVKVAKHELGHMLGITKLGGKFGHCPDTLCVMTSSFPTPDNFIKSLYFCESCISF